MSKPWFFLLLNDRLKHVHWGWLIIGLPVLTTLMSSAAVWQWHALTQSVWSSWDLPVGLVGMTSIAVFMSTLLTVAIAVARWMVLERSPSDAGDAIELPEPPESVTSPRDVASMPVDHTPQIDLAALADSPTGDNSLTVDSLTVDLASEQPMNPLSSDDFNSDSRFIPTQFLRILHRTKLSDVTLGDCTERTMAVMFADIRGFTTLSETMSPQENLHFLNAYLGRMERVIAQNHGFIDKYIGDAIMALFEGGADHAIEAAIGMLQVLQDYNEERIQVGRQPIRIGIGLDIGPLILGTIGGIHRMETTAIGDAVNLASRLEELTKQYSVSVLVSHRVLANVQNPLGYSIRFIDRLHVRGRTQPVAVYEVLNADPIKLQTLKRATASLFEEGVLRFHRRQYREAAALFEECLNMNPTDRATHIYLQRSVLAGFPPSEHTWQLVKGKVIHKRRRYRGRYRAKSR